MLRKVVLNSFRYNRSLLRAPAMGSQLWKPFSVAPEVANRMSISSLQTEQTLVLTELCQQRIQEKLIPNGKFLRIAVKGGGKHFPQFSKI